MAFTHIDCFSGPGGICTGLHAAGFETKVAIEYIKSCVDTYSANHPEVHVIWSDIREVKEETGLTIYDPLLCGMEEYKADNNDERYLMLFYKTDKFDGELKSSKEGKVFWINKDDLLKYELSLDLDRIYKIMTDDSLSELIYEYKNGEYISYIK